MSPAQAKLLRHLIEADRAARVPFDRRDPLDHYATRWIEVGPFVGYQHSTVQALEDAGLVETRGEGDIGSTISRTVAALRETFEP